MICKCTEVSEAFQYMGSFILTMWYVNKLQEKDDDKDYLQVLY